MSEPLIFSSWQDLVSNLEDAFLWGCRDLILEPVERPSEMRVGFRDRKTGESWMIGIRDLRMSLEEEPPHLLRLMGTREGRKTVALLLEGGSDQIGEYLRQGGCDE